MLLVIICIFEKYCWAVVLHSKLSVRKSFKTEKEKAVSICLDVAGKRPILKSCLSYPSRRPSLSEHWQKRISISKTPWQSTSVMRGFPDFAVRALWAPLLRAFKEVSKWSNNISDMIGVSMEFTARSASGCGVSRGVGSCSGSSKLDCRRLSSSCIPYSDDAVVLLRRLDVALAPWSNN